MSPSCGVALSTVLVMERSAQLVVQPLEGVVVGVEEAKVSRTTIVCSVFIEFKTTWPSASGDVEPYAKNVMSDVTGVSNWSLYFAVCHAASVGEDVASWE